MQSTGLAKTVIKFQLMQHCVGGRFCVMHCFLTAVAHIACQQDDAHSVKWLVGKDADFYHRDCRNKSPRDLIRREGAVNAYLDACEVPPCWWVGLPEKGVELAC